MARYSSRTTRALCLASLLGAPCLALAQATPPSIAECAAIEPDRERLACYDRVSGRATPVVPAQPAPVAETPAPPAPTEPTRASLIDAAWGFNRDSHPHPVDLYQQNYLLFARYTDHVNTAPYAPLVQGTGEPVSLDDTEAKFQISFKARLWTTGDRRWGVWAGYTQQNQWQVYNSDISRPFRETNYMPELFVSYRPGLDLGNGFRWNLLNVGYVHQSNGRTDVLSRSWDRLFAEFGVERDLGVERSKLALLARVWYRIKEDATKDDNPDITDYYGYGSLTAIYKWHDHSFALTGRGNLATGKGAAQLTWMSPRLFGPLRAYVQAFFGYGESLIDYNWNQNTIGVGVAINDAL